MTRCNMAAPSSAGSAENNGCARFLWWRVIQWLRRLRVRNQGTSLRIRIVTAKSHLFTNLIHTVGTKPLHAFLGSRKRVKAIFGRFPGFRIVLPVTLPDSDTRTNERVTSQWMCDGSSPVTVATTAADLHRLPFSCARSPRNWAHRTGPSD